MREFWEFYPVANARVLLFSSESDWDTKTYQIASGLTDANGLVVFPNLESSSYFVDVWEKDHNNYSLRAENIENVHTPQLMPYQTTRYIAFVDKSGKRKGIKRSYPGGN